MDSFSNPSPGSSQQLSAQDIRKQLKNQLALEYAQQFLEVSTYPFNCLYGFHCTILSPHTVHGIGFVKIAESTLAKLFECEENRKDGVRKERKMCQERKIDMRIQEL
ncbi:hypothetical protein V8G54_032389 [Vigna mungo]|uniref:Uncharacterized protein n=1 Tax=Vigna mungo TaxID=3915 RepID=A0AAQ3ML91_VIGMU